MLKFNLIEDEELRGVVNAFISSLLPHQNFDSSFFSINLATLLKYVHLTEFRLEHRLLIDALNSIHRISMSVPDFVPKLSKEVFGRILEASILDDVIKPELGVSEWLGYEGLDTNLNNQVVKEEACQKICSRALELYDECFMMAEESSVVLNLEPELRASFVSHIGRQAVNAQYDILISEYKNGRKIFRGSEDWLEFTSNVVTEMKERLRFAASEKIVKLDSLEGSYNMLKELSELMIPIADYGIPELDRDTPILRHRLVVVVGRENIGKTKFAIDKAVNVLLAGGRVVYMCGESAKPAIFADMVINYVYKSYGVIIRKEHLVCPESCPDEVRKAIGMSLDVISRSGQLVLCDAFNYVTLDSELNSLYEQATFDMVVIDHSCALIGSVGDGSLKSKIDALAVTCREFKKNNPVCVMVTSHPSVNARNTAKADRATDDSTTKGSSTLSAEADEVFYLRDNETLMKSELIMLENVKRRDAGRAVEPIVLRKRFEVSAFEYDSSLQSGESRLSISREEALEKLDENLKTDNDLYCLDI